MGRKRSEKGRKPHDFETREKRIKTSEPWYPTFADGTVRVRFCRLTNNLFRVSVWGDDDFGMEFDQPSRMVALDTFKAVTDFTTQKQLEALGFVRA